MLERIKHSRGQLFYTLLTILLLCTVIVTMIGYVYNFAEEEAFITLHLETKQIKNDIKLQLLSDRENLLTMANFAAKLYADGESFDLMFQSFETIGLIEDIGVLLPDNRFMTKRGIVDASAFLSFDEEREKNTYISGKVHDVTHPDREMIRSAVPIIVDGETVGILYGTINLDMLAERYAADTYDLGAEFYLIEGTTGDFLVDTMHERLGSITSMASVPYQDGYSYDRMISELSDGVDGYSAFQSQTTKKYIYVHYSSVGLGDWRIMLSKPEDIVFASAKATGGFLIAMFVLVVLIMAAYLWLIVTASNRRRMVNVFASQIRKRLLDLNRRIDGIEDALNSVRLFAKSRSAFFVDTYGEDHNDITSSQASKLLTGKEREYFIQKLLSFVAQNKTEKGATVQIIKIELTPAFKRQMPEFYEFLKSREIRSVRFASILDYSNNTSLIGVINPKNKLVDILFKDIAVCFSMAIYNKKHLVKTEALALTDPLTGLSNRMAYKQDSRTIKQDTSGALSCVYIDVNELHYFNNKYGHAAGDQMLVFIAEVLSREFFESKVYRMGGDEFLIFAWGLSEETLKARMEFAKVQIEEMKYHVSFGIATMDVELEIEELVNDAEKKMLEDKAKYYHDKELSKVGAVSDRKIETMSTGVKEVDACLAIMSTHYPGAYCVSLKTDRATQVLAPSYYFQLNGETTLFSDMLRTYIHDLVKPEFQRSLLKLLDYEILERQLKSGHSPRVAYNKIDGEALSLSVYAISDTENQGADTVWLFEKEEI